MVSPPERATIRNALRAIRRDVRALTFDADDMSGGDVEDRLEDIEGRLTALEAVLED